MPARPVTPDMIRGPVNNRRSEIVRIPAFTRKTKELIHKGHEEIKIRSTKSQWFWLMSVKAISPQQSPSHIILNLIRGPESLLDSRFRGNDELKIFQLSGKVAI
jgi:hypothetical protein